MSLRSRLILRASFGLLLYGAMLFVPACALRFWQAWVFLAIALAFILLVFGYFYRHDRILLERRTQRKEKRPEQRRLVQLMRPAFFLVGILPCLDHRLGWSQVPS